MTAKEALEQIAGILEQMSWCDYEGEDVWYVLAALRGPDSNDDALKHQTTWRIRQAFAPRFFHLLPNSYPPPHSENFPKSESHHFDSHYRDACDVLYRSGFLNDRQEEMKD